MKRRKISYAVLWGKTGVKDFRKFTNAKKFARRKANKIRKRVEIDKIERYPWAKKPGMTDWSQSLHRYISPKKR